jgi:hypothetical protein
MDAIDGIMRTKKGSIVSITNEHDIVFEQLGRPPLTEIESLRQRQPTRVKMDPIATSRSLRRLWTTSDRTERSIRLSARCRAHSNVLGLLSQRAICIRS